MTSLIPSDTETCPLIHTSQLQVFEKERASRNTGIICTIGPASRETSMLKTLISAGMNIARMNFSHGSHDYHRQTIANLRQASEEARQFNNKRPVAIALDTKGPEIRTGNLKGSGEGYSEITLVGGKEIFLTTDKAFYAECTADKLYVDYERISKVMKVGQFVFIDDGLISLKVKEIKNDGMVCEIMNGGSLGAHKGVNLPDTNVDLPALSERDIGDLKFGLEQNVEMVFASFIRKATDVDSIRAVLGEKGKRILVISKIENKEGINNINEIIENSDGIMVARGDMGIEIPAEKVFLAQKMIISKCNLAGKAVICATQMLESMTINPRPTRAETSDVANAVLDGADCVMLSGETAKGSYPLETVQMMSAICREAEAAVYSSQYFFDIRKYGNKGLGALDGNCTSARVSAETTCIAAVDASFAMNCSAIIVLTTTGKTAQYMSRYRPSSPILVVTRDILVARQLHLYSGCFPIFYETPKDPEGEWMADVDARVAYAINIGKNMGLMKNGGKVVVVTGWKSGPGFTNTIRILDVEA